MSDGYDHVSSRYRRDAPRNDTPEETAAMKAQVQAALNKTFGVKTYTADDAGWLVGGVLGNGEVSTTGPENSPAWRHRIEKARREIDCIASEMRVREAAVSFSREDVLSFIEEIRRWANSLQKQV